MTTTQDTALDLDHEAAARIDQLAATTRAILAPEDDEERAAMEGFRHELIERALAEGARTAYGMARQLARLHRQMTALEDERAALVRDYDERLIALQHRANMAAEVLEAIALQHREATGETSYALPGGIGVVKTRTVPAAWSVDRKAATPALEGDDLAFAPLVPQPAQRVLDLDRYKAELEARRQTAAAEGEDFTPPPGTTYRPAYVKVDVELAP